jgi:DNA repair protein RadA/Sms
VRIGEPGADLAVALAIASAAKRVPLTPGTAAFGEVGLTGRLRPATQAERRLEECAKLGLTAVVAPPGTPRRRGKITVLETETVRRAMGAALSAEGTEKGG